MVVGCGGKESGFCEKQGKVLVILVVGLFDAIAASSDFCKLASQRTREVGREFYDDLVSICHVTSKFPM